MKKTSSKKKSSNSVPLTYRALHWVLFALVIVNIYVVFCFERDRRPVVVHETVTTISNHVWVVTNVLERVTDDVPDVQEIGPTNELGGIRVNDPAYEIPLSYHAYQQGSRYYVQIGGFQFGVGDSTSYGRIKSIFPERILLDNGYSLKNQDFEQRFGFTENARRLRRDALSEISASNGTQKVPALLFPGETVLPSNWR